MFTVSPCPREQDKISPPWDTRASHFLKPLDLAAYLRRGGWLVVTQHMYPANSKRRRQPREEVLGPALHCLYGEMRIEFEPSCLGAVTTQCLPRSLALARDGERREAARFSRLEC